MIIVGHRGARNEAPENTLAGFQYLRRLGIHCVELDIQLSKDQQLVVIHDKTVNRTTNGKGEVKNLTAKELAQLDASIQFPADPNNYVPRLEQVIESWPELTYIQLEVKTADIDTLKIVTQKLAELILKFNLLDKAVVTSSDQNVLRLVQQQSPNIHRGFVAERFVRDPIGVCINHRCSHLVVNHHRSSLSMIERAQLLGLIVSVWTVNDLSVTSRLQKWGADSVITDIPSHMIQHYHETL